MIREDKHIVIVFDCGATNIRVIAVSQTGKIISTRSYANSPVSDPYHKNGLIWDVQNIWNKLAKGCREIAGELSGWHIMGVCTTSFGVDGAPFDKNGKQLYPVISWACQRTHDIMDEAHKLIPLEKLYSVSGVAPFHFNTLYKLVWLNKHMPEVMNRNNHWLFMPSIINSKLCNTLYTDVSMAGTSMLFDYSTRRFSKKILSEIGISSKVFPPLHEAGDKIDIISPQGAEETGLPEGTPVYAAGHDTQFAIFGSGTKVNEPVLSSGTWEILMARTQSISSNSMSLNAGITNELDAKPGIFNPGIQWLASGILEWIREKLFAEERNRPDIYQIMIAEAESCTDKHPDIAFDHANYKNILSELSSTYTRGELYRSVLRSLASKTKQSLTTLETNCKFAASSLCIVGGGSKNSLWNRFRKEELGIPINTIEQSESTVLGAAMHAFSGAGLYPSPEDARDIFLKDQIKILSS